MRKLLSNTGSLVKFNYLKNHKKPVQQIPTSTPPKYVYQVVYHPTSLPDFDMRFPDHKHFDDWLMISYGQQDKFEFQYSGQWWQAMGLSGRIITLGSAIFIVVALYEAAQYRRKRHFPGFLSYYSVGDVAISHLPTIIQD